MGDSNKQICQLCLVKAPATECESINEIKKAMLEFLLININFDKSSVTCNMCLKRLQESYEFKSRCSTTFLEADNKADVNKVFPWDMMSNEGNIFHRSSQVCRLCMSAPSNECNSSYITNLNDGVPLQEMIKYCFPEMDLNDVNEASTCKPCLSSLKKFHEFLKICPRVIPFTEDIPILKKMVNSKDFDELGKSIIIKKECSDAEYDVNPAMYVKNENIPTIKCEELDIKDESDTSVPSGVCSSSRKSGSVKRKRPIRKSSSKGSKNFLPDDHVARHLGFTKVFGCQECLFKADKKDILAQHMMRHKDKSEVDMHKCVLSLKLIKHNCKNCEYETKYKINMINHMMKHRNPKAERKFKCDKCPYETNLSSNYHRHNLIHMDKSEVEMHKCANCEFETRHKNSMIQHMLKHRDPRAEKKFKCNKCPYESDINSHLRRHLLKHKDKSEVEMHKCENCDFETRYKSYMIKHMLKHRDPRAERKFKCDKCSYVTDVNSHLRRHNLIHRDKSEVEMYKCEKCEYETRHKNAMVKHIRKNRECNAERKFKCNKCQFETDFKYSLRRHNLKHKDKFEVEMHKCEKCKYETKYKSLLVRHIIKHCDPKTGRRF